MNLQIVKLYIEEYKRQFSLISNQEIYKWKAIRHFQDNFELNTARLYDNLEISLSKAKNLLDSGHYFPKRMLLNNAAKSPEEIREMLQVLFDEDFDLLDRIESFRNDFKMLNRANFENLHHYQDDRAILVYLTLRFPERYFFYKYQMFKSFAEKIDFTYKPIRGRLENIGQYLNLCEIIRYEIEKDQTLLDLHENRLDSECYRDINHNVLTQDFIFAVVSYFDLPTPGKSFKPQVVQLQQLISTEIKPKRDSIDFTPKIVNHIQNSIENKRIGDLGEIWVLKREIEYLNKNGKSKLAKKVKHVSKNEGDGLGYDILSFDLKGNKKFIEVKTTKGNLKTTFFVTKNELEKSKLEKDNYFLYRVYNFNENSESAKLLIIRGELTPICINPITFKVNL